MAESYVALAAVLALFACCYYYLTSSKNLLPLPPGPPTLPIIGNLHQIPKLAFQRDVFRDWHTKYGPIVSLKLGPKVLLLLGNHKVANDLLNRKEYSERPRMVMGSECVCKGLNTALLPYNARWKTHRRLLSTLLNSRSVASYYGIQDLECKQFLYEMLQPHTSEFPERFTRYTGSILFSLAYGMRLPTGQEPEIREILAVADDFVESIMSGVWIVDLFPVLNNLPNFLAPWKRIGDESYARTIKLFGANTRAAEKNRSWNWTKRIQDVKGADKVAAEELSYLIGELFEAGIDTTLGVFEIFVVASVLHPDKVHKAQEEIDNLVGSDRLPDLEDLKRLPYVNAYIKEVMRWRPTIPSGVPHATSVSDTYEGYHIPRGAIILPNHWSIHLDEAVYEDATSFRPERWIDNPDLPLNAFGFGRRTCPGKDLAQGSLELAVIRLLWGFHFEHAYEGGQRKEIDWWDMEQKGILLRPNSFQASFRIRDQGRRDVIEKEWLYCEPKADSIVFETLQPAS